MKWPRIPPSFKEYTWGKEENIHEIPVIKLNSKVKSSSYSCSTECQKQALMVRKTKRLLEETDQVRWSHRYTHVHMTHTSNTHIDAQNTSIDAHVHTDKHAYTHRLIYTHTHIYVYVYIYTDTHTYIWNEKQYEKTINIRFHDHGLVLMQVN